MRLPSGDDLRIGVGHIDAGHIGDGGPQCARGWRSGARFAATLGIAVLVFGSSGIAWTMDFDYDPRRPTQLRECDGLRHHGETARARACYEGLLRSDADALLRAEAAWAMGDVRRANELFREAVDSNKAPAHARSRWGRLYLSTHQYGDAMELFREAQEAQAGDRFARLGMARVFAERFEGQARTLISQLLQEDDSLVEAHLLAARMDLEEGRLDQAEAALHRTLDLLRQQGHPPLEAFELLAALELLRGGENTRRWIDRALAYNPRYGGVFETLAYFEVMRRRYRQAVDWLRQAVEIEPELWSAHAELGVNLLRLGEVNESRAHLERAYAGDPYSATTVNTLRLLDSLKAFEVHRATQPDIVIRLHRNEADALRPYVHDLARESIRTFSRRYGFEPREPVTVELYPNHDDFAVRTAGLPGIGLLGVTFGYVLAMDSPSGRSRGEFHWGTTLWHEMAHVFTLSLTDHRVPRWLSEGISVFEEWRTGPTPGVALSASVLEAFREGRFLPIASLDEGFIRPRYPDQIGVSYQQAGLFCLFVDERWGLERLVALLHQFTRETDSVAALEATFGVTTAELDRQFDAFMRQRFATALTHWDEWRQSMSAAHRAAANEDWKAVIEPARRAVEIFPEHTGEGSAHLLLAQAYEKAGRRNDAMRVLLRYHELGGWNPEALKQLATWHEEAGDARRAVSLLSALMYVDPLDASLHARLGEQLLHTGRADEALREFRVLLALDPHDRAAAGLGVARALWALGDTAGSRRRLLDTLETAPHYRPAQRFLLEMVGESADE
mgnify:CR=1 FL=1